MFGVFKLGKCGGRMMEGVWIVLALLGDKFKIKSDVYYVNASEFGTRFQAPTQSSR